ncbi:MAG TPA: hypothetical protein VMJ70_11885 [Candidatus Sulfotelmatobacter sp.]|nr:hypothetical protein [Candidatus Sulfotelmatobacter sp.]
MTTLRGLLFDNLGLKLIALLIAVLIYLNAYTERPATLVVSFPIQLDGLADTLSLSGPMPSVVQAELRGTGKQLIRLRLTEPRLRVSLAGVGAGRFERAIAETDLPISNSSGVTVERLIGPRMLQVQIDHRAKKMVPLAGRVDGAPASGDAWDGTVILIPPRVLVTGPAKVLADLDSLEMPTVRIDGRRDTVRALLAPESVPDWCTTDPALVHVLVPVVRKPL